MENAKQTVSRTRAAIEGLRAAAKAGRAILVEDGGFEAGRTRRVDVEIGMLEFMVRSGASKIAYLDVVAFDLDDEVEAMVAEAELGEEAGRLCAKACKDEMTASLARAGGLEEGDIVSFQAVVMVEGVAHVAAMALDPYPIFLEALETTLHGVVAGLAANLQSEEAAALRAKADALIADPRFNAPKMSKSKREFLARELFPGLENKGIANIVEEAENVLYFESLKAKPEGEAKQVEGATDAKGEPAAA